jgi:thimet oligopeptidase
VTQDGNAPAAPLATSARKEDSPAAAALAQRTADHLERARRHLRSLREVQEPRTVANTLVPYDNIAIELDAAGNVTSLLERVHPDPAVRSTAERWTQEIAQFATDLSLDRDLYEALRGLDTSGEDASTQYYVTRSLRDFRRAGVDKDEPTRDHIRALNDELVLVGQEFARNIQSDRRVVKFDPAALDGLPPDYILAHPPDGDGKVGISTDYPDYVPFMNYAHSGLAREALYRAFRSRGTPANLAVLDRMLALRHELAGLLGYASWAAYATEDKMIRSDAAARSFVMRVAESAERRAREDYSELLRRKRQDQPGASEVFDWEKDYYEERIKAERYRVDSQAMRAYFPYARVKQGILDVTSRLFGVEYRRAEDDSVWAPDVETYDVYEAGERLGRFHLDMHPRADKYKHAAQFTLANGVCDRQLPAAALVCNFPGGPSNENGLLEHDDVVTFFHEFGHLLHGLFAGRQRWIGTSGVGPEWDFVEAPSQMLEEWAWDVGVLQRFARHHDTGEPIPAELVESARRARNFGKGTYVRQQMFYAMLSLYLHDRSPSGLNTTQAVRELQDEYSMFRYVEGTFFHASFGHLDGYSALYYTYMWSLVIAKDLFSEFPAGDLFDRQVAQRYRSCILDAGNSAPAAQMVQRFLGRPFGFEAFEAWLAAR